MRPYLFEFPSWVPLFGGQPLYLYGAMLGVAFLVGWSLCTELCRRDGMPPSAVSKLLLSIVVSAVLGARLMHFVTAPDVHFTLSEFVRFSDGGMVAYGGMLAAVMTSAVVSRAYHISWWQFGDNAIPGLALGLGITRIGCFFFGCDYGMRSEASYAVSFPRWDYAGVIDRLSPAYTAHHESLEFTEMHGLFYSESVIPTQLMESLVGFLLFGLLLCRRPFVRQRGELIHWFFGLYGMARFGIEVIRGDVDRGLDVWGTGMTPSQLISWLALTLVSLSFIIRRRNRESVGA